MLDAGVIRPKLQRARGRAGVSVRHVDGKDRLQGLSQSGSAKVLIPNAHGRTLEAVFLNTAGGVTGGDVFDYEATAGQGTRLIATTQTAERAYASTGDMADVSVKLSAGPGAFLAWLPQETILFDTARLRRRTTIDLAEDATFLGVETTVLGRAAMGEVLTDFELDDLRAISRAGMPHWIDPVTLTEAECLPKAALNAALAVTTVIYSGPDAMDRAKSVPDVAGLQCSAWDGKCVLRGAFPDLWPLTQSLIPVLTHLMRGPLPRVWQT